MDGNPYQPSQSDWLENNGLSEEQQKKQADDLKSHYTL